MSHALNTTDPAKQFLPTKEFLLDYCAVRSPSHARRFILVGKHEWEARADGEKICARCFRTMRELEKALEVRERKRNIKEI